MKVLFTDVWSRGTPGPATVGGTVTDLSPEGRKQGVRVVAGTWNEPQPRSEVCGQS